MAIQRTSNQPLRFILLSLLSFLGQPGIAASGRDRSSINSDWTFQRFETNPDGLSYDDLKPWIMPCANNFIEDSSLWTQRPDNPPSDVEYAQADFDDGDWESLSLPHDWAIKGPFYEGGNSPVSGGVGRLPIFGVGWYRRTITIESEDSDKAVYLEVDGAMSYSSVWLNGVLVGGWPYGYASFRLDLTPYVQTGDNQLAIRLEQETDTSRWYPGAGLYRNVWLTKVNPTHVGQYGVWVTPSSVSANSATLDLVVSVENSAAEGDDQEVNVVTDVHEFDASTRKPGTKVGSFPNATVTVAAGEIESASGSIDLSNPKLWGPAPAQEPNLYVAVAHIYDGDDEIDTFQTNFGVRSLSYENDGLHVNGERVYLQGTCRHTDLGSLGTAVNERALERQVEMLQDMGLNAIRTSHNPPEPELLELADRMGILILDEIFDAWNVHKVGHDFATIFPDWSEPDLRSFIRRDRNHPSIWAWSFGNEIPEQTDDSGLATGQRLKAIIGQEDDSRMTTMALDQANPNTPIVDVVDLIGLNYQGEGRGFGNPTFPDFRSKYPDRFIFTTESSSVVSSRGTYLFPVTEGNEDIVDPNGNGADPNTQQVSAYELYAASWGATPDKVFGAQDRYPFVGGEFTWTGWDYIGEPMPYDSSRSSYFGSIDLAGFPKDRFYLYQARWKPDVKMAHILPHWNWPDRNGQTTPVHVFSSADEAELFVNDQSQGRLQRGEYEYRFRWDDVVYQPGEVRVVAYKNGKEWANSTIRTTSDATKLQLSTYKDRDSISADGRDLLFVSVAVVDDDGQVVPDAEPTINFSVDGDGEIVSTDNGDPTDMTVFPSTERAAFRGRALAIVRAKSGGSGIIIVTAKADSLDTGTIEATVA